MTRFLRLPSRSTIVAALLVSANGAAQSANTDAETLFNQGRAELAAGQYDDACDKLRRSDSLDPAPGTKLNLGECEASRGRVATAWGLFLSVEQQLAKGDVRLPIARSKREAIESRLPKLNLTLAPSAPRDTQVRIGDRVFDVASFGADIVLDPGNLELVVTAPGQQENRIQVTLDEGRVARVEVAPRATPPAPTSAPARSAIHVAERVSAPRLETANPASLSASSSARGAVALGLGISMTALAGVAGVLTLQAKQTNDAHCSQSTQTCDSAGREAASRGRLFGALTTAGLALGAVGIGLGTYWIVQDGHRDHAERRSAIRLVFHGDGARTWVSLDGGF